MERVQELNRQFEATAWGLLFIWWGITELFLSLPDGIGAVGIGVILLGLNVMRLLNGIPTSGFTSVLGILALTWGGLELAGGFLDVPFELPIFAILLIMLGVIILVPGLARIGNK